MSNDQHHEETHAALFDAWYELQNARAQERLDIWIILLEALFGKVNIDEETQGNMARTLLWSIYEKNPRQFAALFERPVLEPVKG